MSPTNSSTLSEFQEIGEINVQQIRSCDNLADL